MTHYDLVIVGAGSGNMLPRAAIDRMRVAIVERDRFGGTCLNRGCIPSKMLVYAADVAETVRQAARFGIRAELIGADWPAIRDRVFARTDRVSENAVAFRRQSGVDVHVGEARFVAPHVLEVGGQQLRSERIVLAVGSRPSMPEIDGLTDVSFHTTDTIMRVDARPESMVVIGGGYVAAEMSHVFGAFGTEITIVEREPRLLATLDDDVAQQFTERYAERFDVRLATKVERVERTARGVAVHLEGAAGRDVVEAETILLAAGRIPNSDVLDVAAGGIAVDEHGHVITDETYTTSVPGVWAIGDLANHFELKHLANAEMRIVLHNALHADDTRRANFPVLPAAVFADPQIATAGPTERALREQGKPFVVARRDYADTGYGWALEDTTSFVKLIADPATRRLLAAHIIGPQAATLIQPLVQAIYLDNTVEQLAHDVLYIHPAASEVIAQALLELPHLPT
ncbi:MAG: mycothione reductase [Actinomycetota bacterium]|jgi:mycothione reductase|nr:mycothione reductase [Actinomycetota bacterium]